MQLARVTLWMGHKLAVDELDLDGARAAARRPLGGIRRGRRAPSPQWPRADAIIGNPPYHGTKLMRSGARR